MEVEWDVLTTLLVLVGRISQDIPELLTLSDSKVVLGGTLHD